MDQTQKIDAMIGARIKSRRTALKISQTALAEAIGVRFQASDLVKWLTISTWEVPGNRSNTALSRSA